MASCIHQSWIGPYHDGELTAERSAQLESHLRDCPACSMELEQLRMLSQALLSQSAPMLPLEAAERLHEHVGTLTDRSLRRFAEVLSGVAAAVLVMASAWILRSTDVSAEPLPPWENAAETLQTSFGDQPPALHTTQWIVTQLQPGKPHE